MGLINPKPRFAYDTMTDTVYDYVAQRDVPLTQTYSTTDGVWNLFEVKRLILAGSAVEGARTGAPESIVKVVQPTPAKPPEGKVAATIAPLSVAELIALKLTALQCAALGITPTQLTVTGVTAEQIKGWKLTEERAAALGLNAAQRQAFVP